MVAPRVGIGCTAQTLPGNGHRLHRTKAPRHPPFATRMGKASLRWMPCRPTPQANHDTASARERPKNNKGRDIPI